MKNLVLITSVIKTSKNPLRNNTIRSVYPEEERFEQTKKTIQSVKEYIPNSKILFIECSELTSEQEDYFKNNVDYYINYTNDKYVLSCTTSYSKSKGEGTMTIKAIEYIFENGIEFENLFKLSGRYYLADDFDYAKFDNDKIVIKRRINKYVNDVVTILYKLPKSFINDYHKYLLSCKDAFDNDSDFEWLFKEFIKNFNNKIFLETLGVNGLRSINGNLYKY